MNLILETQKKLERQNYKLKDLQECLNSDISIDAKIYLNDEFVKAKKYIKYYSELLEVLEIANKVL